MNFVEIYYSNVVGCYPCETDEYRDISQKRIDYLIEAGIPQERILQFVEEAPASDYLTVDMYPDWLWDNSLLHKDKFYFHNTLQIISKAPSFSSKTGKVITYPFFLEMKITYTMTDLIGYFYRKVGLDIALLDLKRDSASFKYLLERYSKIVDFIEPIDFVLSLIDYAKGMCEDGRTISNVFDIKNYEQEVYTMTKAKVTEAAFAHANKIVWR